MYTDQKKEMSGFDVNFICLKINIQNMFLICIGLYIIRVWYAIAKLLTRFTFQVVFCKRLNCTCAWCYALSEIGYLIFTSFKRHIRTGLKKKSKTLDFSHLITGKTSTKITLTYLWHAASRYAQSSDIQTVENNVQDNKSILRKV